MPTVATGYQNKGVTNAEFKLQVTDDGGGTMKANAAGVVYSATTATPMVGGAGCTNIPFSGTPTVSTVYWLTNAAKLTPGTEYHFRAYAENNEAGRAYSTAGSFTTECFGAPTVTSNGTSSSVSFEWNDVGATQYVLRVWKDFAGGGGGTTVVTDKLTRATTGRDSGAGYANWTGKHVSSDAYYGGNSAGGNNSIQLRGSNGSGIITTNSGGNARRVSLEWNSNTAAGRSLQIYGKSTAYSIATNLYDGTASDPGTLLGEITNSATAGLTTTNFVISGNYPHIGVRPRASALYLDSLTIEWEVSSGSGGSTTNYYGGDTGAAATSGVEVSVPVAGWDYNWSLTAKGGSCADQTVTGMVASVEVLNPPEIGVEMATTAFGSVTVGNTATLGVDIYNYGDEDLTVSSITFTGTGSQYFSSSLSSSLTVEGGEGDDSVTVTFAPTATGTYNNVTMHVFSDDPENGEVTLTLSGTGASIANPSVTDSPTIGATSVDWGTTRNGYDVMVVKYASSDPVTAPTGGTAYSVNQTIGAGTVVYKGNGNSTSVSDLTAETGYKFVFYSVNNNYYSPGVTKSVTTEAAGCATRWAGGPAWGDATVLDAGSIAQYVTGQTLDYVFYGAINLDTQTDGGWTAKYGLGTTANGTGWTWNTATRDRLDGGDTWFRSVANEVTLNAPGNWYAAFQFKKGDCTYYAHGAWEEQNGGTALSATRYFAVKDSWASWMGHSFVVAGGTWYDGTKTGSETAGAFDGADLGVLGGASLALGGQIQTFGNTEAGGQQDSARPVLKWEIWTYASPTKVSQGSITLPYWKYEADGGADPNHWYGNGGSFGGGTVGLSGLTNGKKYTLKVWFEAAGASGTLYDEDSSAAVYSATFVRSLTTPSIGSVSTTGAGTLSGADSGATYVVVRKTSNSGWGTPSGGLPTVGNDNWCGGTVVYVGTTASFTDATVTGCASYYYKAWTKAGEANAWSAGSAVYGAVTMVSPGTPVVTMTNRLDNSFEIGWTPGPGPAPTNYLLSVTTGGSGGSGIAGTYTKITSLDDLTEGNYLVVAATASSLVAMSNTTMSAPAIHSVEVANTASATSLEITADDAAIVWHFAYDTVGDTWSIKNEAYNSNAGGYAASSGNGNYSTISSSLADAGRWKIGLSGGNWAVTNVAQTNRWLRYNSSQPRFACYTTEQTPVLLFKQGGGTTTVLAETVLGNVTNYMVSGLSSGTEYEYSLKAEGYGENCRSVAATGTVQTTASTVVPGFTEDEVAGTATVGDATHGTYQLTKTPDTGWPAEYTYSAATVTGTGLTEAGEGTYGVVESGANAGRFTFTPTAGGTYKFRVTAVNTTGSGSYTVTVTVTPRKPSIGALTPGAGTLGGTVSGLGSGATVLLRRYADDDDADDDTDGASVDGTTVVNGALAGGTFTDTTGLTGCVTYYYKVRQTENGQTSDWSDVVSGSPTVGAMGAVAVTNGATSLGFGWAAVAGAAGYKVEACLEGDGEAPTTYTGEGTFTRITSVDDFTQDGFYVLMAGNSGYVMNKTVSSSAFQSTLLAAENISGTLGSGGTVVNPPVDTVWQGTIYVDDTVSFMNVDSTNYVTGIKSNANVSAQDEDHMTYYSYWVLSRETKSGVEYWRIANAKSAEEGTKRGLLPTTGHVWKNYAFSNEGGSDYLYAEIYKLTGGGSSCVSETTTAVYHTLTGLESGEEYSWTVTPYGASESCTGTPQTGEESTSGTPTAPVFSPATGEENATVGTELEVTLPAATGYPKAMTYALAGPSSGLSDSEWSFTAETREFTFTPTAVGDYVFTLTAVNTTGSGTYALTVHVGAGVPVIGAVSAVPISTSASVSATGVNMKGAASTAITLEYLATTGTGVTPSAPLTAATGVEPSSLAAGTTSGSLGATLEGLTTGTWYYYKWTVTSSGGTATAEGWFETGCIDAPVVTAWHSGHNLQLSWPSVTGADDYKVEVSTDSSFAGAAGEPTTVVSTLDPPEELSEGWSYVNGASAAGKYHKLTGASGPGVVSEAFPTVGYSRMTLNYKVATFGTWSGTMNTLTVSYSLDDGATWTAMDSAAEAASGDSYVTGSMEMDERALGKASVRVKWSAESATASAGLRLQALSVTGAASGSTAGTTADPAVTTLENGKVVWRWTAAEDGSYYYRVTARGGGCEPATSEPGGPVDLSEASVLSIGAPTRTTIPWTLTPQAAWAGWVLVWNEDGEFGTPPDGVAPGAAEDSFAGGTILQKGTGGSSTEITGTHTGLYACDYHFYKVFAYAEGYVWDTTLHTEMGRTLDPLPPTGVTATGVGTRQFTVNWTPQANDGAARYELTVTKGATISSETTTVLDDSFASGVPEGWTDSGHTAIYDGGTQLASGKQNGSVTSGTLNLSGNGGEATLTVNAKQYSSKEAATLKVEVQVGSGSWETAENLYLSAEAANYPVTLTGCNAATKIRLSATSGHRVVLYSAKVEQEASSSEETTVLAPTDVTSGVTAGQGSWTVTGLDEYTEYHFGVRAVGTECDGDWVTETVTTLGGPMIGTRPIRLGFGRTTPNTPVTVTLVVTNSGHGPLTVTGATFGGTLLGPDATVMKLQENGAAVSWPMVLAAGTGRTLTVTWTPTTGGTLDGTLTLANDTEGLTSLVVPLSGTCRDPMSEPPQLTGYEVRGPADRENTVWDDHLKKSPAEGHEVTVKVWLYHASGIATEGSDAPSFKIYTADETTLKASGTFTSIREVQRNKREEMECTATVSGWTGDATPGEYRVLLTAHSVNGHSISDADTAMPEDGYYELDRFDRRDEEGNPGHGWTIRTLADADEVVALKGGRLVINGSASGQPGVNGRGGVVRDMQGGGYATEWGTARSQLTWAFNFAGGRQAAWGTFNGGQYAGAFVLGATSANLFGEGTTSAGYAVVMRSGKVQLARMSAGLGGDASLTPLGDGYPVADGRQAIGVKVAFVPASEHEGEGGGTETVPARLMLYVKEWEGRGVDAIAGDSVTGHGVAYETVDLSAEADAALLAQSLRYVGMAWNHASSAGGATTYGAFDDVYVPHEEGNGVPMAFDVADEDIEGPVFADFNARGAFTYTQIPDGGLSVTGLVSDASGVYGANNRWTLYSNDTQVATGSFTATPNGNGAATNVALSGSIAKSHFTDTGTFTNYVLEVESTDYDTDWEGDELSATARYHFTVTDQVLTEPTSVTADADGAEMVVLRWNAGGNWVAIVEGTNAIPEDWTPPQGTDLEAGQVLDGPGEAKFRVVYVGNGAWVNIGGEGDAEDYRCSEATELTVAPGSTNYYRVYGTASGYYGKGIAPANYPVQTPKYEKGEIVDSFSYPDKVVPGSITVDQWKWASDFSLDRAATGAGWAGGWWFGDGQAEDEDGRAWKIHDGGLLGGTTEFPAGVANKLFWNDVWELDQKEGKTKEDMWMKRKLASPMSGGKVFVAFQMNYQFDGAGKYILVTLTGGENFDQEIVSFGMTGHDYTEDGKRYASLTIPSEVTKSDEWYTCQVNGNYQGDRYQFHGNEELGVGQDYVIVGELDWTGATPAVRMWAFYKNQPIPQDYDSAGGNIVASLNCAGLAGQTVTGVKIGMGSPAKDWLGQAYVDELRLGKTWDETLLFNKPEVLRYSYGETNGVDKDGHTLYKISDGQLAGHDPVDMSFMLYHRSGIQSAHMRVLDPFASGETTLAGWQALALGAGSTRWGATSTWTTNGDRRDHINLASNYTVQVKMTATGGKTNMVTSAAEGGGAVATDLFIGEYGEGESYDKYIELYNGLDEDIDLRNYYVARMSPGRTQTVAFASMTNYTTQGKFFNWARVTESSDTNVYILPKHSTVVLLNNASGSNEARMGDVLTRKGFHWIMMTNEVLDAGGDVPILLFKKEVFEGTTGCDGVAGSAPANSPTNKPWLDACGYSTGVAERYIMSRLVESEMLPRSFPLLIEHDEWDHRRWSLKGESDYPDYSDFLTTAGVYDSNIGLGGNMEFTVYDDDTEPPTIGSGSKIHLGSEELAAQPGTTETVLAGWTFYEDGNSSKLSTNAWGRSMLTNAAITVGPRYAAWLETQQNTSFLRSEGTDVNKEFAGLTSLANAGRLVVQPNTNWLTAGTDHTWVRFRFGMVKAEDRMFSFADHTASTNSFSSATLEWSTTGRDADDEWTAIASWNPQEEVNTWTLRSFDLSEEASGIPADAATLYLRVNLSGYSGRGSMWSMDNVQLTGYPDALRVSDKELHENGFAFDANVYDESGVDRAGMEVTIGTAKKTPSAWSTGNGITTNSLARAAFEAVSDKAEVTAWYTNSLAGLLHVGLTAKDLDDDRTVDGANVDQETAEGHFGILQVYDDDEDKPAVEMTGMRAVGGTNMVQWKFVQDGSLMPTAWDDALTVSRLGAKTDSSSEKNMHWLDASGAAGAPSAARGVRQSGWQHGTKFWYFTMTPEEDTQITSLQMFNHINSKYGPTHFTVTVLQGGSEVFGPTAATYFLGSSTATWEDNLDKLNTWIHKSLSMNWTLEKGKTYEFRIQGLGGNKRQGVGAYWGVYDLQLGGSNAETNGMTIKTDADLRAGGTNWLHGSVYDTYSGLDAATNKTPKFTLTGPDGNTLAENRPLVFATALEENGQKKSEGEGRFTAVVPGMGYTDRKLGLYGGWVSAWDADDDRTEDSLEAHVGLALTVVDNDVKEPSAPASVKVNGVPVPDTAPDRDNVTWTNKPEFLVSFNVATDQAPTTEELSSEEWCTAHGVKSTTNQTAVTGIGEYRVSLANTAAAISNAPGFSVAVTNGAVANGGFEETNAAKRVWSLTGGEIVRTNTAVEGAYCLQVPNGTAGNSTNMPSQPQSQVFLFDNQSGLAPRIGGSLKYYLPVAALNNGPEPRMRFDAFTDAAMTNRISSKTLVLRDRSTVEVTEAGWITKTFDYDAAWNTATTTFDGGALGNSTQGPKINCVVLTLYNTGAGTECYFDDVRIGIKVGDGTVGTMRYEPDAAGQGLAVKHLFAVDADNDRPGDRLAGPTAAFYTAYDITPPTVVTINRTSGLNPDDTDDPTSQFDVKWSTSNVGPDDPEGPNYENIPESIRLAATNASDVLSPWATYRFYHGPFDEDAVPTNDVPGNVETGYIYTNFIATGTYKEWAHTDSSSTVADPSAEGANYNALTNKGTGSIRLYDLENDQHYAVVVVGVDAAGNEGPAGINSWATNNTIKFMITQGVMRAKSVVDASFHQSGTNAVPGFWGNIPGVDDNDKIVAVLGWNASGVKPVEHTIIATNKVVDGSTTNTVVVTNITMHPEGEVKKPYDLIYWDAKSFNESAANEWKKIGGDESPSVQSNWFADAGGLHLTNEMRFYRAAYKDRWRTRVAAGTTGARADDGEGETAQRPMMSEDVYAMSTVPLTAGINLVSLHGMPWTNTLRGIFGVDTATWPAGASTEAAGTKVELFDGFTVGGVMEATKTYFFLLPTNNTTSNGWWCEQRKVDGVVTDIDVTDELQDNMDLFTKGFSITLPCISTTNDRAVTRTFLNEKFHEFSQVITNGTTHLTETLDGMYWRPILRVPTNGPAATTNMFMITVRGGGTRTNATYNFVNLNLPVWTHPSQWEKAGLPVVNSTAEKGGFRKSGQVGQADLTCTLVYPYDQKTKSVIVAGAMYCDANGTWRKMVGNGTTSERAFPPNSVIVIVSRSAGWTWSYSPSSFYTLPTRWGGH